MSSVSCMCIIVTYEGSNCSKKCSFSFSNHVFLGFMYLSARIADAYFSFLTSRLK